MGVFCVLSVRQFKLGSAKFGQTWQFQPKLGILGSNLAIREMEYRIAESES
jgi:hypothetical protein